MLDSVVTTLYLTTGQTLSEAIFWCHSMTPESYSWVLPSRLRTNKIFWSATLRENCMTILTKVHLQKFIVGMLKSTSNLSQQFCQWFYIERKLFTTYVVQQLRVLYGLYLYCTFVPANIGITNPLFNQSLIFNWLFMFSVWYTYLQL
jgi:hypothetical protein